MESHRNLIGTWTLMSCVLEDVETKQQEPVWGSKPNGYLVATSAGRWIVIQTAEGRRTPSNDQDRLRPSNPYSLIRAGIKQTETGS